MDFDPQVVGALVTGAGASGTLIAVLIALVMILTVLVSLYLKARTADSGTLDLISNIKAERDQARVERDTAYRKADDAMRERNEAVQQVLAERRQAEMANARMLEMEGEMVALRKSVAELTASVGALHDELREARDTIRGQSLVIEEMRQLIRGARHESDLFNH